MSASVITNPDLDPIQMNDYDNRLDIVDEYEKDDCDSNDENIVGERLRGDGQEQDQLLNKKIDDDEDRRNPQYIPKRGNFYEHDDRTLEDVDAGSNDEEVDPNGDPKVEKDTPRSIKKVWEEKGGEKWGHDLYNEKEQLPKSKQELINAYGYDIRNEDGPPRARRRRRYGRGPNKYTRNWEDEDAYSRSQHNVRTKKNNKNNPPVREDFPPLNPPVEPRREVEPPPQEPEIIQPPKKERNVRTRSKKPQEPQEEFYEDVIQNYPPEKPKKFSSKPSKEGKSKHRHQEGLVKPGPISSQSYSNSNRNKNPITENLAKGDCYQMTRDMANLKMDMPQQQPVLATPQVDVPTTIVNSTRQSSMPPRLQQTTEQRMGPKRYSSLRQRSLPETLPQNPSQYVAQQGSHAPGYYTEYTGPSQPEPDHAIHRQMQMSPQMMNQIPGSGAAPPANVPPQLLLQQQQSILAQQPQVSHHPQLNVAPPIITHTLPPQSAPPHQQPLLTQQAMLNAAQSQHITVQNHPQYGTPHIQQPGNYNLPQPATNAYPQPPVMNYTAPPSVAQAPPQYTAPYPAYQQAFTAPPAQPPQDLYQTPGGITYYSPHSQTASVRALPLKRPKAAIPILAPPERLPPRGRGRSSPTDANDQEFNNRGRGRNLSDEIAPTFENYSEVEYTDVRSVENAVNDGTGEQDNRGENVEIQKNE